MMKTKLIIEIESKDKIMCKVETGDSDKPFDDFDIAKETHADLVKCITDYAEKIEEELPEDFEDGYVEGYDEPEDYGIKITVSSEVKEAKDGKL